MSASRAWEGVHSRGSECSSEAGPNRESSSSSSSSDVVEEEDEMDRRLRACDGQSLLPNVDPERR